MTTFYFMKKSYPAGFVYVYTLFYAITSRGLNIKLAQYIFIGLYLIFMCVVFTVYNKTKRVNHKIKYIHSIWIFKVENENVSKNINGT